MRIDDIRAMYNGQQIEQVAALLELAARYAAMASVVEQEQQQLILRGLVADICQRVIDKLDRLAL